MTECSICCEKTDAKLPCWMCTGDDKAYCESCFASIAQVNSKSYNMEVRCPYCRTKIEIHLSQNNTILIIVNTLPMCSLSNTSNLNLYIRKAYRRFADRRRPSPKQLDEVLATMIQCEHERYLFKTFIIQTSTIQEREETIETREEVPMIPIDVLYMTWNRKRDVLESVSATKEEEN
jgi:hypothetical protein